jgi:hypothetical protein
MDRHSILEQFESLFPLAIEWAKSQEERILNEGEPLTEQELHDAHAVGVREPSRVRLLQVESIPRPLHPLLRAACNAIDFLTPSTRGLTLQYGIFVRSDCWRHRALIVHELAHAAQYERLGGFEPFLRQYLHECLTIGYPNAPLEQEAIALADRYIQGQ